MSDSMAVIARTTERAIEQIVNAHECWVQGQISDEERLRVARDAIDRASPNRGAVAERDRLLKENAALRGLVQAARGDLTDGPDLSTTGGQS